MHFVTAQRIGAVRLRPRPCRSSPRTAARSRCGPRRLGARAAASVQSCCTSPPTSIGHVLRRASGEAQLDVLRHQREPEARGEPPGEHVRRELVGRRGVPAAARVEDLEQRGRVETRLDRELSASRGDRHRRRGEEVVQQLRELALPGRTPTWKTEPPNVSSSGRTRSKTARSPDAITASVRARAPATPPLTGASRYATPALAAARRELLGHHGARRREVDERPQRARRRASPPSPATTSRTTSGVGRLDEHGRGAVGELPRARARLPLRRSTSASIASASRSKTASAMARAEQRAGDRCAHRAEPDEPDRPSESVTSRRELVARSSSSTCLGDPEGLHPGRDAARTSATWRNVSWISSGVTAVVDRAADVDRQLVRTVECREHREVDEAAVAAGEAGSRPDLAPAVLRSRTPASDA